jgi:anti-anti-sigma regulatory factor
MGLLTLRITIEQSAEKTDITLEGRIAGPWVAELRRAWTELKPLMASRALSIDLRNTTYADTQGVQVLREIYAETGAHIVTSTPWTQYIAEEIMRKNTIQSNEEI